LDVGTTSTASGEDDTERVPRSGVLNLRKFYHCW
jgi:hypothetical protein